jgi:alanine racemase
MMPPQPVAGFVEVSLGALKRNFARLSAEAGDTEVGAVVKANAYGLGASRIAQTLIDAGCSKFFVATLEEGIDLRASLQPDTQIDIYVFEGLRQGAQRTFAEHRLAPVLNTSSQLEAWLEVGAPCAVHVDTGMSRLGIAVDECEKLLSDSAVRERLGLGYLMTHLACADNAEDPNNERQLAQFTALRARFGDTRVSIANSAGVFLGPRFHGDLIRAGIALYGGNPFSGRDNPMDPVASLYGRVLQLRELDHDASVGYGATFAAPAGSRIATVGVGYADGYPRMLGNLAEAVCAGQRVPVVGRVSMDLTCVDVSAVPRDSVAVGDYVEMFGQRVLIDEIAAHCNTISYEILTGLGARLPRIYAD